VNVVNQTTYCNCRRDALCVSIILAFGAAGLS
jgi:hypothetical protein